MLLAPVSAGSVPAAPCTTLHCSFELCSIISCGFFSARRPPHCKIAVAVCKRFHRIYVRSLFEFIFLPVCTVLFGRILPQDKKAQRAKIDSDGSGSEEYWEPWYKEHQNEQNWSVFSRWQHKYFAVYCAKHIKMCHLPSFFCNVCRLLSNPIPSQDEVPFVNSFAILTGERSCPEVSASLRTFCPCVRADFCK